MKLIGFNFNKISIEKKPKERPKDLKINTNIDISEIKQTKPGVFNTKEEILAIQFYYKIDYTPDFAKIGFSGSVLLSLEPKIAKKILKQWKKKQVPEEVRTPLLNLIMTKSNIRALQLEEEMNLPYHIPLPSLTQSETEEKKKNT